MKIRLRIKFNIYIITLFLYYYNKIYYKYTHTYIYKTRLNVVKLLNVETCVSKRNDETVQHNSQFKSVISSILLKLKET